MKLLLDTHAFLWLMFSPEKLSKTAMAACQDNENALLLSVTSLWEMQVKHQLGKLELDLPLAQIVREQTEDGKFTLLTINAKHVLALDELPIHPNDPFDRLLIAQARTESAQLVTVDRAMHDSPRTCNCSGKTERLKAYRGNRWHRFTFPRNISHRCRGA